MYQLEDDIGLFDQETEKDTDVVSNKLVLEDDIGLFENNEEPRQPDPVKNKDMVWNAEDRDSFVPSESSRIGPASRVGDEVPKSFGRKTLDTIDTVTDYTPVGIGKKIGGVVNEISQAPEDFFSRAKPAGYEGAKRIQASFPTTALQGVRAAKAMGPGRAASMMGAFGGGGAFIPVEQPKSTGDTSEVDSAEQFLSDSADKIKAEAEEYKAKTPYPEGYEQLPPDQQRKQYPGIFWGDAVFGNMANSAAGIGSYLVGTGVSGGNPAVGAMFTGMTMYPQFVAEISDELDAMEQTEGVKVPDDVKASLSLLGAIPNSALESLSEIVGFGSGLVSKPIKDQVSKQLLKSTILNTLKKNIYARAAGWIGGQVVSGAAEEGGQQLVTNEIARIAGSDRSVMDNVGVSALVGGVVEPILGGAPKVMTETYKRLKEGKTVDIMNREKSGVTDQLDGLLNKPTEDKPDMAQTWDVTEDDINGPVDILKPSNQFQTADAFANDPGRYQEAQQSAEAIQEQPATPAMEEEAKKAFGVRPAQVAPGVDAMRQEWEIAGQQPLPGTGEEMRADGDEAFDLTGAPRQTQIGQPPVQQTALAGPNVEPPVGGPPTVPPSSLPPGGGSPVAPPTALAGPDAVGEQGVETPSQDVSTDTVPSQQSGPIPSTVPAGTPSETAKVNSYDTENTVKLVQKYKSKPRAPETILDRPGYVNRLLEGASDESKGKINKMLGDQVLGEHGVTFAKNFDAALRELDAEKIPYTYVVGDIGNMKGANDHFGSHDAADDAMRETLGKIWAEQVRAYGGIVERHGGDELKEVWPNYTVEEVTEIRADIEQQLRNKAKEMGIGEGDILHARAGLPSGAFYTNYGIIPGNPGKYGEMSRTADKLQEANKEKAYVDLAKKYGYIWDEKLDKYIPQKEVSDGSKSLEQEARTAGRREHETEVGISGQRQESGSEPVSHGNPEGTGQDNQEVKPTKHEKALTEYREYLDSLSESDKETVKDLIQEQPKSPSGLVLKMKKRLKETPKTASREEPKIETKPEPPADEDEMPLLDARNLLISLQTQLDAQGRVVDDRLVKKVEQAKKLVKELEAQENTEVTQENAGDYWWKELTPTGRREIAQKLYSEKESERVSKTLWVALDPKIQTALLNQINKNESASSNTKPDEPEFEFHSLTGKKLEPSVKKVLSKDEILGQPKGYGESNTVIAKDAYEKARERLKKKLNQLNIGMDPEMMLDGATMAVYHIEAGSRKFSEYSKAMIADLGDKIKPYLRGFYENARHWPGFDTKGMSTSEEIEKGETPTEPDNNVLQTQDEKDKIKEKPATKEVDNDSTSRPGKQKTGKAEDVRDSLEGSSPETVSKPEERKEAEDVPDRKGQTDDGELQPGLRRKDLGDKPSVESGEGVGTGSTVRNGKPGVVAPSSGDLDGVQRRKRGKRGNDHRIPDGGLDRVGSWKTAATNNLDAIELSKKILAENRPATPEEQEILSKYVGWGATELANKMFPGYSSYGKVQANWGDSEWRPLVDRMLGLLTEDEIKAAARSTQYAHYTSEGIIKSIYKALRKFGFAGGKILEPGMGTGNFIGLLPDDMLNGTVYTGIEMDNLTAGIAKLLYPNQNILQADFTKQKLPAGFFDLAIGNPPFSKTKIIVDPEYRKFRFPLHNYFFAKSIDRVRPGGLMVFVTSRYTMDSGDNKMRQFMSDRADFIGAIRLPQTAFKKNAGTEVVTDVLFLRKRNDGEETAGESWGGLSEITAQNKNGEDHKANINEYFVKHPEMVLGRHSMAGSMYSQNEYTVMPMDEDIEVSFAKAVESLPSDIYSHVTQSSKNLKEAAVQRDFDPKTTKEGALYLSDKGKVMKLDFGSGVPVESMHKLTPQQMKWLKDYIGLRDAVKNSHHAQITDGDWKAALADLQKAYKAFIKKHGKVKQYTIRESKYTDEDGNVQKIERRVYKNDKLLKTDVEHPFVLALEHITEAGDIIETATLKERTLKAPIKRKVDTVFDAMAVSLDELGRLDLQVIADEMRLSRDEVVDQLGDLIYEDPSKHDHVLADEYLSGEVVKKLEEAIAAADIDTKYKRNVEALKKVQPDRLSSKDITVTVGANWVPTEHYNDFASEVLDLKNTEIIYHAADNSWAVMPVNDVSPWGRTRRKAYKKQSLRDSTSEWSSPDRGPNEILEAVLNNRTIKITKTDPETRKTFVDEASTVAANEIAKKMRERFSSWVWEDSSRAGELLDIYNSKFNTLAPRVFNGDHLTLPGTSLKFPLYSHQKRAIWRIIQTGDTYLAHSVGAGKTFVMIAAGMEMKRLGMSRKPLYVVPNHMLEQFSHEFKMLYPLANIMVADESNFHTTNRRRFVAQAALNNPDAIILTHSSLGLLGMKPETIAPVKEKVLREMREALSEMQDDDSPKFKIKRMEQRIEQAEQRFDSMVAGKDDSIVFEDMGTDFMFLDEAHMFRKLDFVTNRQAKGIDPNGSKRAMDLYIKLKHLDDLNPGRSHVFASGTPVTNTLGEIYSLMRFFNEESMKQDGIDHFDSWATMFGVMAQGYEMNAAGKYEIVERFAKFINIPELMSRVRMYMDVLTSTQLGERVKRPAIKGGAPEIVVAPASKELKQYQDEVLQPRIETSKAWKPSKEQPGNPDPIINIITDGRLASIDLRFVVPTAKNDPGSKLNVFIDGIIESYKETKNNEYTDPQSGKPAAIKGGTQIVFYNHGFGKAVSKNRGLDARAWMAKRLKQAGIPASQVAWIDDFAGTKKESVFRKVRSGEIRILIGSAKKMGTGVNVQSRLTHLHYLDAPWYPADVEQPDGRIIRQGNQNEEVTIKRYATKGSYDATMWGMVSRKSKFIEQAFTGDKSVRTLEDISESSQYEMAAALASGDERVIELAGLKADIERLWQLSIAHDNQQAGLRDKRRTLDSEIRYGQKSIKLYEDAAKEFSSHIREIDGEIDGESFDNRSKFGQALARKYNILYEKTFAKEKKRTGKEFEIGKLNGASLFITDGGLYLKPKNLWLHIGNGAIHLNSAEEATGLTTKLVNKLNGLGSELRQLEYAQEKMKEDLSHVMKFLGTPFSQQGEYEEKVAQAAQIERDLVSEGEDTSKESIDQAIKDVVANSETTQEQTKTKAGYHIFRYGEFEPIDGKKVDIVPWAETFIHRHVGNDKLWNISEAKTGLGLGVAEETKRSTIASAKIKLEQVGQETFEKALSEKIQEGQVSPWFGSQPTQLSLGEQSGKPGLDSKKVQAVADVVVESWKNKPIGGLEVVQSVKDLPAKIQDDIKSISKGAPNTVRGILSSDGRIYLVADNLKSPEDIFEVIIHETVGHYGLRGLMGSDINQFLNQLWLAKNAGIRGIAQKYGFDVGTKEGRLRASEEWFAKAVERADLSDSLWQKFIKALRGFVRKIGFKDLTLSDAEIKTIMREAMSYVVGGERSADTASGTALSRFANPWYSQMEKTLAQKLPGSGSPQQIKDLLQSWANKGEFKAEELEWSGVNEWLDGQDGKVTKAQVLDFLAANNVQVKEVMHGSGYKHRFGSAEEQRAALDRFQDAKDNLNEVRVGGPEWDSAVAEVKAAERALTDIVPGWGRAEDSYDGEVKFARADLNVPGGKYYKELLLTLPDKKTTSFSTHEKIEAEEFLEDNGLSLFDEEDPVARANAYIAKDKGLYHSSHWGEPNILAHVRFDERTGPDGERVLFIQEVQSDWHQEGRKKGYNATRKDYKIEETTLGDAPRDVLYEGNWESHAKLMGEYFKDRTFTKDSPIWVLRDDLGDVVASNVLNKESLEGRITEELNKQYGVPNAPFKKSWPMLAMRRMVRYAAENGFDRIAWTPGEVQNDRYDLSKHLSSVAAEKHKNSDGYHIIARNHVMRNGVGNKIIDGTYQEKDLEANFGKELSEKIISHKGPGPLHLTGLDLKVGGQGMKGFYDKILPSEMNKFFGKKAWGRAKVGEIELDTVNQDAQPVFDPDTGRDTWPMYTAHSIPITPEMRTKAMTEGMPLFSLLSPKLPDNMSMPRKKTDMGGRETETRPPHWLAKKYRDFAELYKRQQVRDQDRVRKLSQTLEETAEFWKLKNQDLEHVKDLIWRLEGEKINDLTSKRFNTDDDGRYVLNDEHYEEYREWLNNLEGVEDKTKDAFISIRKSLDQDLATVYNQMRQMKNIDESVIAEYRKAIGSIHNYFPHVRYGKHYIQAIDTASGEVIYREHFDGLGTKLKMVSLGKKINEQFRDQYPDLIIRTGEVEKIPEDVFAIPIPIEALEAVMDAAIKKMPDQESRDAFKSLLPEAISDALKSRGWGSHMINRKNIPGFEKNDVKRVLFDYKSGLYGWLTKMDAARDFSDIMRKVDAKKNPRLWTAMRKYTYDMLANSTNVDKHVNSAKAIFFAKYLGLNVKTAVLNTTQNIISGWPRLGMETGNAFGKIMAAAGSDIVASAKGQAGMTADEQRLLKELYDEGTTNSNFIDEVSGQLGSVYDSIGGKAMKVMGYPMAVAERFNRATLALAAFRAAVNGQITNKKTLERYGVVRGDGLTYEQAKDFATTVTEDAHFVYGKTNRPAMFRGGNVSKVASTFYTFRTFTHNMMNLWNWMLGQDNGKRAILKSMVATIALGGLSRLPIYQTLLHAYRQLMGDDPEDKLIELLPEGADWLQDLIINGVPSLVGVDLGGSIGMEIPIFDRFKFHDNVMPQIFAGVGELIGIPGAIAEDAETAGQAYVSGQRLRALESLLPTAFANPLKAYRLYNEGQYTLSGQPINDPFSPGAKKLSMAEAVSKAFGFQPVSATKSYSNYVSLQDFIDYKQSHQRGFADRIAVSIQQNDEKKFKKAWEDLLEWNAEQLRDGKFEYIIYPDNIKASLRARLMPKKPPKYLLPKIMKQGIN